MWPFMVSENNILFEIKEVHMMGNPELQNPLDSFNAINFSPIIFPPCFYVLRKMWGLILKYHSQQNKLSRVKFNVNEEFISY